MPMTIDRSKAKPEIIFQYGGPPFSYLSRGLRYLVEIWHLHFHLLKQTPSLNPYSEVDFRLYGRHLVNSIWRHNSADDRQITTKFGRRM